MQRGRRRALTAFFVGGVLVASFIVHAIDFSHTHPDELLAHAHAEAQLLVVHADERDFFAFLLLLFAISFAFISFAFSLNTPTGWRVYRHGVVQEFSYARLLHPRVAQIE